MDSYRDPPSDFVLPAAPDEAPHADSDTHGVAEIGGDERRMHVRAYNYWVSLLDGRDFPSIEDLEPSQIGDFAAHSVLLDFTAGRDDPATPYVGEAVRAECGIEGEIQTIADVPSRSLLSRLTDHYMQIIANRAPIGFEAEFANQRGVEICYRGILMPFSSDGDTIDFIYGVINWKAGGERPAEQVPIAAVDADVAITGIAGEDETLELNEPVAAEPQPWNAEPSDPWIAPTIEPVAEETPVAQDEPNPVWEDGPFGDADVVEEIVEAHPAVELDTDAGLADRLWAARESADAVKLADGRSRTALYRALSMAYDFALAAQADPEDYAELLEESGVKAQARAPMTPIVKLVFGIDYDKTRLTEFAAALSNARRHDIPAGGFLAMIETRVGGLKALVAAERQERRPETRPAKSDDAARARLRQAAPIAFDSIVAEAEFTLVLARRSDDGSVEPVAVIDDAAMIDRAIRKTGR